MSSSPVIFAISATILSQACMGHMSMQYPFPRDNGGEYLPWQANEPMVNVHPNVCHGLAADTIIRDGNEFAVGDTIEVDLYGTASHNGGHCSFWYSTDDITFTKIIDILDCTIAESTQVTLPLTMPTECETKCTLAWTWSPVSSAACEVYMNCADISVSGAVGGNSNPITVNFADIASGATACQRVDPTTHWTEIFGTLKTEYDTSDTVSNNDNDNDTETETDTDTDNSNVISNTKVITEDDTPGEIPDYVPGDVICYQDTSLAINLENSISNTGTCGNGPDDKRCDDGQCCSAAGYCGPEPDGYDADGNIQYTDWDSASDGSVYYSSESAAFNAYCMDPLGDWRIDETNSCVNDDNDPDVISTTASTVTEYITEYSGAGSLFRGGYFMGFAAFGFMHFVYCLLL